MIKWEHKYKPKKLEDIYGHFNEIKIAKKWMEDFINEVPKSKKVLFITGRSGMGKSILANCLLEEYGYKQNTLICDDIKGKKTVYKTILQSIEYNNIMDCFNSKSKPIGLILDQINILGEGGCEKSGLNEFINMLRNDIDLNKKKRKHIYIYNPIICMCEKLDNKMNKLLKYSIHIHLNDFNTKDILLKTKKIIKENNIKINNPSLKKLISYSSNDYRRFINLFEELYDTYGTKKITISIINKFINVYSNKNKEYYINTKINKLFTEKMDLNESMDLFYDDFYMIPYYIYDTSILYISKLNTSYKNKIKIYHLLLNSLIDYDYLNNSMCNKYHNDFIYFCINSSTIPNKLITQYTIKNNNIDIKFPKLYTSVASKSINNKYIPFNFKNIYLISLIHYHLFNKNGNQQKLLEYLKKNNITNINQLIKYKKMYISFSKQNIKKITKTIKMEYLEF